MEIIWKDIPGYEGLYKANNLGQILSLEKKVVCSNGKVKIYKETLLRGANSHGYISVTLTNKDNKITHELVHRLIAITFLENPNNLECVNHKDENKANNNVNNLEWCTSEYNTRYSYKHTRQCIQDVCNKPVKQYNLQGELIAVFKSIVDASNELGVNKSTISNVCIHKDHLVKDFIFLFSDDELTDDILSKLKNKKLKKSVQQFDKNNILINTWSCIKEASTILNIDASRITKCCKYPEKYKSAGGFKWKYFDE